MRRSFGYVSGRRIVDDRIQVLIVDDHVTSTDPRRRGLQAQSDMELVGLARSTRSALDLALALCPDVIVVALDGGDARSLVETLVGALPWSRIVVADRAWDFPTVARLFQSGASGVMLNRYDTADLSDAIRAVHTGDRYIAGDVLAMLSSRERHPSRGVPEWDL